MKKPWDNEPTPLTDAERTVVVSENGQIRVLFALRDHARELEQRMRAAEKLLALVQPELGGTTLPQMIRKHLKAARKEDGR